MPQRSRLLSLDGDGTSLSFTFEGEGWVEIQSASGLGEDPQVSSGVESAFDAATGRLRVHLAPIGVHEIKIVESAPDRTPDPDKDGDLGDKADKAKRKAEAKAEKLAEK